jgi:D-alanine transaminase
MARLTRSLAELRMDWPVAAGVLPLIVEQVRRRNRVMDGLVYIQVSRGVAHRNHLFPADALSSLVVECWRQAPPSQAIVERGLAVVSRPDERWGRVDIKTVGLLANVMAKQSAKEAGAAESWLVDQRGFVTEGSATNAFIVAADGTLITHPADRHILGGVSRSNVLALARAAGITVEERPFTLGEALHAAEAFASGTTLTVMPVTSIDGHKVGTGAPGPVSLRLRALYQELRNQS